MRVGLAIYASLDSVSGGYLYDRKLVEHLRSQGDEVEVFSLPWRNYVRHLSDNLSCDLHQRLSSARLDILLQDELNHASFFWLNRHLRSRLDYPLVSIVHHLRSCELRPAWQNRLYRAVESHYFKWLDGIIFNSQTTRLAVSRLGVNVEQSPNLVAFPAGDHIDARISEAEIQQRCRQPEPLRVLFIGNVIPRKGLLVLLRALAGIPLNRWYLKVVGSLEADPRYSLLVRQQIAQLELEQRIELCGTLQNGHLVKALKTSHILAVPSSYEGYGIVYLEGMGFGLPAIATTGGAAGEIITHGQDGYLISPGDWAALRVWLEQLILDRAKLLQMSLSARRRYLAQPTWEQTGQSIRKFLEFVIHKWS